MKHSFTSILLGALLCLVGTNVWALEQSEGVYQISSAQDLVDFATKVATEASAKAVLTTDIDMSTATWTTPIGTKATPYTGTFDGQGYSITNFSFTTTAVRQGLFGDIEGGATVKNFSISGNLVVSNIKDGYAGVVGYADGSASIENVKSSLNITAGVASHVGGVVGSLRTATVNNCQYSGDFNTEGYGDSKGGVVGYVSTGKITNCIFNGNIQANTSGNIGGILGYVNNGSFQGMEGCLSVGTMTNTGTTTGTSAIVGNINTNTDASLIKNNFYLETTFSKAFGGNKAAQVGTYTKVTAAELASGAVTYLMNGSSSENVTWYQKIGTDALPVYGKGTDIVYVVGVQNCDGTDGGDFGYSNTNSGVTIKEHVLDADGICTVCNQVPKDDDGYYKVISGNALRQIGSNVNNGTETTCNIRLYADIDLSGENWTPMGDDTNSFTGNLDGQKHTISNMKVDTDNPAGLIGTMIGGTIKDLIIDGTCSVTSTNRAGGLIGHSTTKSIVNVINVGVLCDVTNTGDPSVNADICVAAGIIGNANSANTCNMTSCWTTGKITSTKLSAAFSGWEGSMNAAVMNCWSTSEVTNYQDAAHYLVRYGSLSMSNCYGPTPNTQGSTTNITADGLATGALCYQLNNLMNGSQTWYQTIGTDATPVPWNTHETVLYMGDAGYATMYDATNDWKLNGATAYIGAYNAAYNSLKLTEIADIPAETAVVLAGTYYNKVATTATASTDGNILLGTTEAVTADGSQYVLAKPAESAIGFYQAETGTTIAAGKAYIPASAVSGGVKAVLFDDEDATGIQSLTPATTGEGVIYNLAGQRVSKLQKGINIVNGKKVLK